MAETTVGLCRPTRQKRRGQPPCTQPGPPVRGRWIVSEVRAASGRGLATGLLLSNVSAVVDGGRRALWYYWR